MKIYKAYAKINIFLKITGKRGDYHEIISRFVKLENLYDELRLVEKKQNGFEIVGDFECALEQNTIYKAYCALQDILMSQKLENLMKSYAIEVKKNIPAFAGLGGGSSDAAVFLKICNNVLNLGLSLNELATIGAKVGADVPFFVYGYDSANVSGVGEIVEEFAEEKLSFEIKTPKIKISTPKVYQTYREFFYNPIDGFEAQRLKNTTSKEVLKSMSIDEANDLFKPALHLYPQLKEHYDNGWFFSGSGSSFFKAVNS